MPAGKKEELSSMSEYTTCRVQNSVLVDISVLQFKDHMTEKKNSTSAMVFFIYKQIKIKLNSVHLLLLFLPALFVSLFSCMVMCMMFGSSFAFI